MIDPGQLLGSFEQLVLLAAARLGDDGYGMRIRREIERRAKRPVSIGAVYSTLDRLEEKGHLRSRTGEATPERGGRARRYFELTPEGTAALRTTRAMIDRMWEDLELEPSPEGP